MAPLRWTSQLTYIYLISGYQRSIWEKTVLISPLIKSTDNLAINSLCHFLNSRRMVLNILKITTFFLVSSRKDDIEQLIYTLIFLAKGDLPWSLKKNYTTADIIKAKSCTRIIEMMLSDLPCILTTSILIHIRLVSSGIRRYLKSSIPRSPWLQLPAKPVPIYTHV